jgi:hypothetical protein
LVKKLYYCFKNKDDEVKKNITYNLVQDKIISIQEKKAKGLKKGDVFYNIITENNLRLSVKKDKLENENA